MSINFRQSRILPQVVSRTTRISKIATKLTGAVYAQLLYFIKL